MTPRRALLAGAGALLCGLFLALGAWQVQRLAWKNDLVARVAARAHAEPVAAPGADTWPALQADPAADEYRRVRLGGEFLHGAEQLVQAVTERGAHLVQLTTHKIREDAHRFYERLGFKGTHLGMKLSLK